MVAESRLFRAVLGLALALMVGWLLHVGRGLLTPVVAAVLAVFVICGLSNLLARLPRLGALPAWGRDLIAAGLIVFLLVELLTLAFANIGALVARAPNYQAAMLDSFQRMAEFLDLDHAETVSALRAETARLLNLPSFLRAVAGSLAAAIAVLLFVLLNIGFLMVERRDFADKLGKLGLASAQRARLDQVLVDVNARVGRYLAVQTLLNIALGLLSWAILWAFGVEFAVVFAIVIAVLNYIPYFGSFVGVAFPVAAALVQFADPGAAVWLAIWLAGAQFLIGNIVSPKIMGDSLNLSPWAILIGLTFWTSLWGVAGAVFSVPIMAVAVVVLSEFDDTRPLAVLLSRKGDLGMRRG